VKRVHVYYSGRVHGVGFRYTAVDCAVKLSLVGFVKNLPDQRVEVLAEGKELDLKKFLSNLEAYMSKYIQEKQISWEPASGQFSGFRIDY